MFYDIFSQLCAEKGVSCKQATLEMGFGNSTATQWKKRGTPPKGESLQKIADYFGVTTDYLLTGQKNTPADAEEGIRFALFGGGGEITQEMYDDVLRFAQHVKKANKERSSSDVELLEAFAKADESTKAAIRLLLKVE